MADNNRRTLSSRAVFAERAQRAKGTFASADPLGVIRTVCAPRKFNKAKAVAEWIREGDAF
jgi:hypothetical protein